MRPEGSDQMFKFAIIIAICVLLIACGQPLSKGKTIATGSAGNGLTVSVENSDGVLKGDRNRFTITFADSNGNPVDVGAAAVNFHMPAMGTMPTMNDAATLTTTDTPGIYDGAVKLQMSGEWRMQIIYEGNAGKGRASFPIVAQ